MTNHLTYTTEASLVVIERILDRLAAGPADTRELVEATGRSGPRARGYINHLADAGRIQQHAPAVFAIGASKAAVWTLEPGFVESELGEVSAVDDFPRRVVVRQEWAPNHARMPMECLLFGVPKVLQELRA